eukprot:SAG31_NODE_10120_length_1180_cov_1.271045_2_plen_43_part_01
MDEGPYPTSLSDEFAPAAADAALSFEVRRADSMSRFGLGIVFE